MSISQSASAAASGDAFEAIRCLHAAGQEPPVPVRIREELFLPAGCPAQHARDLDDLMFVMGRHAGCLRCRLAPVRAGGGQPCYRLESDWTSAEHFIAWTRCALFAAVAAQLAGRRLCIERLSAAA